MTITTLHLSRIYEDDNGYLKCGYASGHRYNELSSNCAAIETFISEAKDAEWIKPGKLIGFNLMADLPKTATVAYIDPEPIAGELFKMKLVHPRDVGGSTTLQIGLWSPGEGRASIRASAVNAIAACVDPQDVFSRDEIHTRCPNAAHGLKEDRLLKESIASDPSAKSICLINIVLEKMCTPCLNAIASSVGDDFGLPKEASQW